MSPTRNRSRSGTESDKKKPLSWVPTEKERKRRDVQIARVHSFGTVKDTFEHEDKLDPDRWVEWGVEWDG